ncbi:hypothetical protein ACPCSC_30290 [Streptomyces lavendulocolor]|uniref:hypothetical protein n=1 Tax=Streptomyces lavendulocolor TaxID=67316 RepID=UPI003C2C29C0
MPSGIVARHSSRFCLPITSDAPKRTDHLARSLLHLMLGVHETAVRHRAEHCLAMFVSLALAQRRPAGADLVCEIRTDEEHVFVTVEYPQPPEDMPQTSPRLDVLHEAADAYGTYVSGRTRHLWAAVSR